MSQVHLEHRKHLERELHNAGIKPEIVRTPGGHMRIVFEAGGKPQMILTSWTPSDHRSTLNARARIRKILRNTGTLDKAVPVGKLDKALSRPQQTETYEARIAQLETDVATLLDMLATVAERTGANLEPPIIEPAPEPTPTLQMVTARRVAAPPPNYGSKMHSLLDHMAFTWLSVSEIKSREGDTRPTSHVCAALAYLKKRGLVENGMRGMWRKKPGVTMPADKRIGRGPTSGPMKSKMHDLLLCMEYDWLHLKEIVRRTSRSYGAVTVALNKLKKDGEVENGAKGKGLWRKVAPRTNGHAHANGAEHAVM